MNKYRVNAYFAVLIITVMGSLATLTIVRVATHAENALSASGVSYQGLENAR